MTGDPPGPVRLFAVDASSTPLFEVWTSAAACVHSGDDLAVAVIAAAAAAHRDRRPVWVICPDRWYCQLVATDTAIAYGAHTATAPIDAVDRVLHLITSTGALS